MRNLIETRGEGWRARYNAVISEMTRTPHAWGAHDCVVGLAGGVVFALTGRDVVSDLRGRYGDEAGAVEVLAGLGFATLGDAVASRLEEICPQNAMSGDLGIVAVPSLMAQAVVAVDDSHLNCLLPAGRATLPPVFVNGARRIIRAFKV